jgi:hypothetical protein
MRELIMPACVAAVIKRPRAKAGDEGEKTAVAFGIVFDRIVGRRDADEFKYTELHVFAGVEAAKIEVRTGKSIPREFHIRRREHERQSIRVRTTQGHQRFRVEVIGVRVARRYDVHKAEPLVRDAALGHADVFLVGARVFLRQRIG